MVTKAIVFVDDVPALDVTGQQLIQGDFELGADLESIRINLEECFRQLFPDKNIEVMFPELGETT